MATQATQNDTLAQLRPAYGMRASPTAMKEILKETLNESLSGQTYQVHVITVTSVMTILWDRAIKSSNRQNLSPIPSRKN